MNFEIKVNLNLDVTDRVLRVAKLLSAKQTEEAHPEPEKKSVTKGETTTKEVVQKGPKRTEKEEPKKTEKEAKADKATEEKKPVSLEELRKVAVRAVRKNGEAVKILLKEHFPESSKITAIPEEKREEALELLKNIIAA